MDAYSEHTNKLEVYQEGNDDSFANSELQENSKSFVEEVQ